MMEVIRKTEGRVMTAVKEQVKDLVTEQLKAAGFDPELTAGALTTVNDSTYAGGSYAAAASKTASTGGRTVGAAYTNKKEENFIY